MDKIYLLTTIHIGNEPTHKDKPLIKRRRTVGWFRTLEDAIWVVVCNEADVHGVSHCSHCVVEEIHPGLHPNIGEGESKEHWFKWSEDADDYLPINKPARLENIHDLSNIG